MNGRHSLFPRTSVGHDMDPSVPASSTTRGSASQRPTELRSSGSNPASAASPAAIRSKSHTQPAGFEYLRPDQLRALGISQPQAQELPRSGFTQNDSVFPRRDFAQDSGLLTPPTPSTPRTPRAVEVRGDRPNGHEAVGTDQLQLQPLPKIDALLNLRVDILRAPREAIARSLGPGASLNTGDCQTTVSARQPVNQDRTMDTVPFEFRPTIVIITGFSSASSPSCLDGSKQDLVRDACSWLAASKGTTRIVLIHTYDAEAHKLTIEKWKFAIPQLNVPAAETGDSMGTQALPPIGSGLEGGQLCMHFQALMGRPPVPQRGEKRVVLLGWDLLRFVARKL
ncbi:hypothetical protein BDW74DRAFT_172161 [Aspergillus multicolor]|uniref:uncharacterized protein n=1 Tax=Aspergillus multicolor TaxID=41759 RepID=UPI003CCCFB9B